MNRTKNITKLILLFWIVVWVFWYIQSEAINLTLNFGTEVVDRERTKISIRPIHFKEFENDFGWLFYFNWMDSISNQSNEDNPDPDNPDAGSEESQYIHTITDGSSSVSCKSKIEWFYYNAERWERLWPLDEGTMQRWHMNEQWLTMTWWIYSNCTPELNYYIEALSGCTTNRDQGDYQSVAECVQDVKNNYLDIYSYYWGVTHEYSGQTFILAVWIKYATWTPWIEPLSEIWKTFQWHPDEGSTLPFGLIYDNLWWLGFAWCQIKDNVVLSDLVAELKEDAEWDNLWIYSLFYVTTGTDSEDNYLVYSKDPQRPGNKIECENVWQDNDSVLKILVEWLIWMWKEDDISYYKQIDAGKAALKKTQYFASTNINNATLINYARQRAEILCRWKWSNGNLITTGINCISGSIELTEDNRNKTIIVRNWDVTISPFSQGNSNNYYDIFIDGGNLKIKEDATTKKFVIWINGFYYNDDKEGFNTRIQDKMHDTTIPIENKYDSINEIWVASILKWNFIVNWHIKPEWSTWLNNKYFIYWKLTSLDNNDALNNIFVWRCNYGRSNENPIYPCPGPNVWTKPNPYQNAPLVIIDQNYNSPLLKY